MKLFWSARSPFSQKVRVVAHEAGVAGRIELIGIDIPSKTPHPELRAANPMRKLPTLITDDGRALFDSPVICEYLDGLGGGGLHPTAADERLRCLVRQGIGDGVVDLLLLIRREMRRPEGARVLALVEDYEGRVCETLDRLDDEAGRRPDLASLTVGDIAIGVMLSYLDFRFAGLAWRDGRSDLARWHAVFAERPSACASRFSDADIATQP